MADGRLRCRELRLGRRAATIGGMDAFDWPLAYEAEGAVREVIAAFVVDEPFAARLSARMRDEAGCDFFDFVDWVSVPADGVARLRAVGFVGDGDVFVHPRAMPPRVRVQPGKTRLALRVESVDDFRAAHGLRGTTEGVVGGAFRRLSISDALVAIERMGAWRMEPRADEPSPAALAEVAALWRDRPRADADIAAAHVARVRATALVGVDCACDLFFAEERRFWQSRNTAAQLQFRRQNSLGLGWANHDHHTFRCSRRVFADAIGFFAELGLVRRERYYAGAEAGWGAQIMEQPATGVVVFADVDLLPDEIAIDFSRDRLPAAPRLGTVGLWCGLHGDSFLAAGMHHLEARFDFPRLRDQLAAAGVTTMKPFSDFPFLQQAFTAGERWPVEPARADALLAAQLITPEQHATFLRDGAIGSHLENLQRKGGFKGFNQKSVSAIIAATDPRKAAAAAH